jgi:hypothetical protein
MAFEQKPDETKPEFLKRFLEDTYGPPGPNESHQAVDRAVRIMEAQQARIDYFEQRAQGLLKANSEEVEKSRAWRRQLERQVEITEALIDRCMTYRADSLLNRKK